MHFLYIPLNSQKPYTDLCFCGEVKNIIFIPKVNCVTLYILLGKGEIYILQWSYEICGLLSSLIYIYAITNPQIINTKMKWTKLYS